MENLRIACSSEGYPYNTIFLIKAATGAPFRPSGNDEVSNDLFTISHRYGSMVSMLSVSILVGTGSI
jgi:hypothetical protein